MEPIKQQVRTYIVDNFIVVGASSEFQDEDSFIEHHICDSTGFLELIGFIEETFGIKVEDEEMVPENLDSLNGIAAYIAKKRVD
ncbi:MAG: acyl carrier protein [Burkholderiales bacterium]